ncbi:MAG: cytochrome c [Gammaproteobacteria bacterium]|nr:MAG: cytochrome c [Gammaproteobacteria bacterium]
MTGQTFKQGEKILFIIFGIFMACAVVGYILLEIYRHQLDRPMFKNRVNYVFSEEGKRGYELYSHSRCNSCHRVLGNGTNNGNDLDGIGSKRSLEWLVNFLNEPEKTYPRRTFDHGALPKEAYYVEQMPKSDLHAIAVFLSELKVEQGSSMSPLPPRGRSEFIDNMVGTWAPKDWKDKYQDVRQTEKYLKSSEEKTAK